MADLIELKVPDIGDFDSVEIIEVLVAEGDSIKAITEPSLTLSPTLTFISLMVPLNDDGISIIALSDSMVITS